MHMVVGFILASLLRKKKGMGAGLPSIRGKLETKHALPGRLRFSSPLLIGLQDRTQLKIGAEINRIDGIQQVDMNEHTGSLLIRYDPSVIEPFIVHGIVVKVLGLEKDLEKSPDGLLTREMGLIGRSLNQHIYESSGGLMDLKSALMMSVFMLALYRIVIQGDRALPGGINLIWWTYILAKQGS